MSESQRLEARINVLERRQRRTWLLVALVVLAFGGLMGAKGRTPAVVDAKAFVLVDDAGKTRGQLALAEDGTTSLLLTAQDGANTAGMTVLADGSVALQLKNGKRRSTWEIGTTGTARVRFNSTDSKTAVELGIDAAGKPRLILNDGFGKVVHQAP